MLLSLYVNFDGDSEKHIADVCNSAHHMALHRKELGGSLLLAMCMNRECYCHYMQNLMKTLKNALPMLVTQCIARYCIERNLGGLCC